MGRSILKKVGKRVLAYLIIAPMVCCGERPSESESPNMRVMVPAGETQQLEDSLRHYRLCADSLRNSEVDFAPYYAFAYEQLLDKEYLNWTSKPFSMQVAFDLIHIFPLNDVVVVTIEDRDWSRNRGQQLELYFVDKEFKVVHDTIFEGTKYQAGNLRIWKCQKPLGNGVVYELNHPVSSVPAGSHENVFYQLDKNKKLHECFRIEDLEWEFTRTNPENFDSVSRQWQFISPTLLKVVEEKWWTNGFASRSEGEIPVKERIASRTDLFKWNKKLAQFVMQ